MIKLLSSLVLLGSVAGIGLAGIGETRAAEDVDLVELCTEQAREDGIDQADFAAYVEECVKGSEEPEVAEERAEKKEDS